MIKNKIVQLLTEIGLSENEAVVYFTGLNLGSTTVAQLAKAAEIKRTTVYTIIESLKQKGLFFIEMRGFKQWFTAAPPEKLKEIVDTRKNLLANLMPELNSLYHYGENESVMRCYEGKKGVLTSYKNLLKELKPGDYYLVISDPKKWEELDKKEMPKLSRQRAKLRLETRLLLQPSDRAEFYKRNSILLNQKVNFLPKNTNLTTNLIITPKKVLIHQLIPPIVTIEIENQSVIQMHKEMFEVMWNKSS
jgi:sugar-specific transcriptional regulator TrmB